MPHLRASLRRGAGGKTHRVYAVVDAYWDVIEGDFAEYFGIDAMDWFRGLRPWNQFLRLIDRLALIEGTGTWAAKFTDPDMLEQLWDQYQKDRRMFDGTEAAKPTLMGFTRQQAMLTNIANLLIAQRMDTNPALGKHLDMLPVPDFPKALMEERWRSLSARKRNEGIEAAQERWQAKLEETGVRPNG